jgi:sugar-specific transcriptional regulator TrmB
MNSQELNKELESIGLSDKEAKVYLASLKLGGAAIQDIAEEAGVNRSTTHVIMLGLIERGLASSFTKGKKRHFSVESPSQLVSLIAQEEQKVAEKERRLQKMLPMLRDIYSTAEHRTQVRFLEGKEGLKTLRETLLETDKNVHEILSFIPVDKLYEAIPDYDQTTKKQRVGHKVRIRSIYTHKDGPIAGANSAKQLRDARYVPRELFPFDAEIVIHGDKAQIISLEDPIGGVVIENKQIVNTLRQLWNLAWKAAEEYNKKK